jgi:hypothetical protein
MLGQIDFWLLDCIIGWLKSDKHLRGHVEFINVMQCKILFWLLYCHETWLTGLLRQEKHL